ncbi:MAG: RNA degradosome polyphosphate kinase [Paracoccaceae bacterium]
MDSIADFLTKNYSVSHSNTRISLKSKNRFFNRELSWISFNWRVLQEAENENVPLMERVKFLSISASNLDEFYSVRVAGIKEMVRKRIKIQSDDGLSPLEQLRKIDYQAKELISHQQVVWKSLVAELRREGIDFLAIDELTKKDVRFLEEKFLKEIFPVLSPMAIDPGHPFPFIASGGFALALSLKGENPGESLDIILPVPAQIDRFHRLEESKACKYRFILMEDILSLFMNNIFPGYKLKGKFSFRLLRDSDLELEEEAEDLVREFETALKRRRRGEVIRMKVSSDFPVKLLDLVSSSIGVSKHEIVTVDGLVGMTDLHDLQLPERSDLMWPEFKPRLPERVEDYGGDIFSAIKQKDMLLHHPYETFETVIDFIKQAASDPNVLAIKQTLYRTSWDSPVVKALCEAAENGKYVTALIELKARFDEATNIRQSRALERAGAQVVYGFIDWKTHAKVSTVVRREGQKLVTYTHIGTGNYHPINAKIYTDLSLFTCDEALGSDANKLFNYVSGYAPPLELENLRVSPLNLKSTLIENIRNEIEQKKAGKPGVIWAKLNSLVEPDIIDWLYEASNAGVQIKLIIRGICGLRPGIKGLSENIRIKSIIGRFLEHSRIACFGNGYGLPSKEAKVYISSADWMSRNLTRRIETLVEIKNKTVHAQIVEQIMAANLADTEQSWVLDSEGIYHRGSSPDTNGKFNCHKFFIKNPSMSGRGKTGGNDVPKLKI